MTIFATTKDSLEFLDKRNFNLEVIAAVVDNCTTMTALNNRNLFTGDLKPMSKHGVIAVGRSDYEPTHVDTA